MFNFRKVRNDFECKIYARAHLFAEAPAQGVRGGGSPTPQDLNASGVAAHTKRGPSFWASNKELPSIFAAPESG